jgi:hypothetical protein
MVDGLMAAIARKYGTPPAWLAKELADYIESELDASTAEARESIYRAISRACKMADGYPDVAAVRGAVWMWSKDGMGDLARRRRTAREYDPDAAKGTDADETMIKVDWVEAFRQARVRAEERKR